MIKSKAYTITKYFHLREYILNRNYCPNNILYTPDSVKNNYDGLCKSYKCAIYAYIPNMQESDSENVRSDLMCILEEIFLLAY